MNDARLFQVRLDVSAKLAATLREDPTCNAHDALREIMRKHGSTLQCQFDAFADYVREAERVGPEQYPLYQWTRDTIANPQKKEKYLRSFTVYVNGEQIYPEAVAKALQTELLALAGHTGIDTGIEAVRLFDTNPANSPQPPGHSGNDRQ